MARPWCGSGFGAAAQKREAVIAPERIASSLLPGSLLLGEIKGTSMRRKGNIDFAVCWRFGAGPEIAQLCALQLGRQILEPHVDMDGLIVQVEYPQVARRIREGFFRCNPNPDFAQLRWQRDDGMRGP